MEREKKIRELADALRPSHTKIEEKIEDALCDAWNRGFKLAIDKAFAFILERTPEDEREQLAIDFIIQATKGV